jgi:hypothetical protein
MACAPTRRRGRARPDDASGGPREILVAETLVTGGGVPRSTFRRFPLVGYSRRQRRKNIGRIGIGGDFCTFRYPFEGVAAEARGACLACDAPEMAVGE